MSRGVFLFLLAAVVLRIPAASGREGEHAAEPAVLTIAEVLSLPAAELDRGVPVRVQGVVTLRGMTLCLQDGDHGIWCTINPEFKPRGKMMGRSDDGTPRPLELGMLVEVEGVVDRGIYAPTIRGVRPTIIASGTLPPPATLDIGRLMRGGNNAIRVEVGVQQKAIVQGCHDSDDSWHLIVDTAARRVLLRVWKQFMPVRPDHLIDAEIRLIAVAGSSFNDRAEFVSPVLVLASADDLVVASPPPSSPFDAPRLPLDRLATYRPEPLDGHRVCVEGIVTCVVPDECCFLQDGRNGIRVACTKTAGIRPGDQALVAGFIDTSGAAAGLVEAVVTKIADGSPPAAAAIPAEEIMARTDPFAADKFDPATSNRYGTLVTFQATLLERQRSPERWSFALTAGGFTLTADLHAPTAADDTALEQLATGSIVQLTGVSHVEATTRFARLFRPQAPPPGPQLLLRSAADIAVLRHPSWWTPRRLAALLASVMGVLLGAIAWVVLLRRQVRKQAGEMAEAMRSQNEAAIEFETALRERNRLAANLHDTVLQTVTGIGYQLQACEAEAQRSGVFEQDRLTVAHRMVDHAVQQLRGTVWALHTLPTGDEPLPASIEAVIARLRAGHETSIRCHTEGPESPVSETVVATLLLVVQEAVTNALRHAAASTIDVTVQYGTDDTVTVTVTDNGRGFSYGEQPGSMQGHFGIDGMHDRMQGIDGECRISSEPGRGTTVTAVAPRATEDDLSDRTGAETISHG